jgi:hypothetical protein
MGDDRFPSFAYVFEQPAILFFLPGQLLGGRELRQRTPSGRGLAVLAEAGPLVERFTLELRVVHADLAGRMTAQGAVVVAENGLPHDRLSRENSLPGSWPGR